MVTLAAGLGCIAFHVSNLPVVTVDRGDYSGVIRRGHEAYFVPSGQVATIWPDGSDETCTMVYQDHYGDQELYNFNNDDPFDLENDGFDLNRMGARSLCVRLSDTSRIGVGGDGLVRADFQASFREFARLEQTS